MLSPEIAKQINDELEDLYEETKSLENFLQKIDKDNFWESTHVCSSAVEKIYTGIERILSKLCENLDGVPIGKAENWHQIVLQRASIPYGKLRDRIISVETLDLLNNLRGFRHRERNSYGKNLDLDIVIERAYDAISASSKIKNEIQPFIN